MSNAKSLLVFPVPSSLHDLLLRLHLLRNRANKEDRKFSDTVAEILEMSAIPASVPALPQKKDTSKTMSTLVDQEWHKQLTNAAFLAGGQDNIARLNAMTCGILDAYIKMPEVDKILQTHISQIKPFNLPKPPPPPPHQPSSVSVKIKTRSQNKTNRYKI